MIEALEKKKAALSKGSPTHKVSSPLQKSLS